MKAFRSTLNKAGDRFITLTMTEEEARAIHADTYWRDDDVGMMLYDAIFDALISDPEPSIVRSQSAEETP